MDYFRDLHRNIRFYILIIAVFVSGFVFIMTDLLYSDPTLRTIRTQQIYSLISFFLLYIVLLAGPLTYTFKALPFKDVYMKARRALGVSAFYFGTLHFLITFFGQLGGFEGVGFLSLRYLLAVILGIFSLFVLMLLAITSFDWVIEKMTYKWWKLLHRFVYIAGVFVIVHTFMLGTHFQDIFSFLPQMLFILVFFLLLLEANRFDVFLKKKLPIPSGVSMFVVGIVVGAYLIASLSPTATAPSLNIHAEHIQQARQAVTGEGGDEIRRYTASLVEPQQLVPGEEVGLRFAIFDSSTGSPVRLFDVVYEKLMHLIIVDESLDYYAHLHPELVDGEFVINHSFPEEGTYHLYIDFQPRDSVEQQFAYSLVVGQKSNEKASPEFYKEKSFAGYDVSLEHDEPLKSERISSGYQSFQYSISKNGNPVNTLEPYLGAFGHMVMVNTKTHEYVHVHPNGNDQIFPDSKGGPTVEFTPLGLYGLIDPGVYKVFTQFNPDGELILTEFFVTVE